MHVRSVEFATPYFDSLLKLRDLVLRKPLGMQFEAVDIAQEYDSIHLGCFDHQDQVLATLILKPISSEIVKMRQVAVDPTKQSKGIGSYIVAASERVAQDRGYRQIVLHARESARDFYLRNNYQVEGEKFIEVGIPHYKMSKIIAVTD